MSTLISAHGGKTLTLSSSIYAHINQGGITHARLMEQICANTKKFTGAVKACGIKVVDATAENVEAHNKAIRDVSNLLFCCFGGLADMLHNRPVLLTSTVRRPTRSASSHRCDCLFVSLSSLHSADVILIDTGNDVDADTAAFFSALA